MAHANVLFGRRGFLFFAAAAGTTLMVRPDISSAAESSTRIIALHSCWSDENFVGPFFDRGEYLPDALAEINHLFRDRHTNDVRQIDVRLLDLLHAFKRRAGYRGSFEIVCGYRSAATNRKLRKKNRHVAKESRHVIGQAVDLRFHGLTIDDARETALAMKAGGVGYYPKENCIHLDVGPLRSWSN
jgi:uncharacterized protein YcbK (DUF882 family)